MRTDVKVGLFVGIGALLLAGWFFWPRQAQKPTQTVTIGGMDGTTADRPVVRPGHVPGLSPDVAPALPAVAGTAAPTVLPVVGAEVGGWTSCAGPAAPSAGAPVASSAEPSVPAGSAQSATAQPTGASVGREPLVHVVRAGDTLDKIAQAYYGNAGLAGALRQANPQLSSKHLRAGSRVKIPDQADLPHLAQVPPVGAADTSLAVRVQTGTQPLAAAPASQPSAVVALGPQDYKVVKGDTLYSIAVKQLGSGKRWHELLDVNIQILAGKPANLRPGMILRLAAR